MGECNISAYFKGNSMKKKRMSKAKKKVKKVMHEWKEGELHSGSKSGPVVENPKQAVAIALSEAKMSKKKPMKKKKSKKPC
jgi:hypothetical protein